MIFHQINQCAENSSYIQRHIFINKTKQAGKQCKRANAQMMILRMLPIKILIKQ